MESMKWTRPLNDMESMMCKSISNQNFMTIRYTMKLASKNPINESDLKSALIHLQRKVPTLRLSIREREDKLYFVIRENEDVDFKVGETSDFEREHGDILYQQFDSVNGPLWRCRLFPCPHDTVCPIPELQEDFPYQYNLLLAFHHSITDGASNVKISNLFLQILNDVIGGIDINDEEQLGYHATAQQTEELLEEIKEELNKNEEELKSLIRLHELIDSIEMKLIKAYPSSTNVPRTKTIYHDLTVNETQALFNKCKSEGVTVNSAMCAAIEAAIVELLERSGIKEETYDIPLQNLVNLRRYWKDLSGNPLGTGIAQLTLLSKVHSNVKDNFWNHARSLNKDIKDQLNKKQVLKEIIASESISPNDLDKFLSNDIKDILNYSYVTSNMGVLKFQGEGEHVQATHLSRCTALQKLISVHEMHTFRGRLLYALDYGSEYLSDEGAKLWCDAIFNILKKYL